MALIPDASAVKAPCDKYANGRWYEVTRLPELAYDHSLIAAYALKRLKSKLEYSNIANALLPREFTFAEFEEFVFRLSSGVRWIGETSGGGFWRWVS